MAESDGEKTEAPTARRRQEARDQGNIAKSHDLTSSVLLLGGLFLLKWFGPGVVFSLRDVVALMLSGSCMTTFNGLKVGPLVVQILEKVGMALAPAITLNRMYHWVPSAISRTLP